MIHFWNPMYRKQTVVTPEIVLRVWDSDYGVPSVEPDSLLILCLLKIYNVPFTVTRSNFPLIRDIPSIQIGDNIIPFNGPELISSVRNEICQEHLKVSIREQQRLETWRNYFLKYFAQTFIFESWLDESNYAYAIDTWFSNAIPFPFGHKYVENVRKEIRKKYKELLRQRHPVDYMIECHKAADTCLEDFSNLLTHKKHYFFNNRPTSLDATVFTYLTIALHMPLQKPHLQNMIKRYPKLIDYVKFMTKKYFPEIEDKFKYVERVCPEYKPLPTAVLIQAAAVVGSTMIFYAGVTGLINLYIPECIKQFNISDMLVQSNFADHILYIFSLRFSLYLC